MWRREGGELVSRSVDDDCGTVASEQEAFTFPEQVYVQKNLSSPRSSRRHGPQSQKRTNSSSTDSQRHSTSIHRHSFRLRNIGPPRRCESSELADSPVRTEAIKVSVYFPI